MNSNNNNTTNGATLEDCHSNFFALTDLCGIRWRRLVSDGLPPPPPPPPSSSSGPGGGGASVHNNNHHHHHHHSFGPLDDPVLSSYARCLAADILCVWRRSPNTKGLQPATPNHESATTGVGTGTSSTSSTPTPTSTSPHFNLQQQHHLHSNGMMGMGPGGHLGPHSHHNPPPYPGGPTTTGFPSDPMHQQHTNNSNSSSGGINNNNYPNQTNSSLNGPKELWIFWYGEEPDLQGLVNAQLLSKTEPDQGSWESGLSYECRTLLFKALHNLIEKCLLARDFVRIGKWFIQPSEDNQRTNVKNFPMQLSFSFAFFLHGESTVCMSADVRQHPSLKRVNRHHLQYCQSPGQVLPVILAPHGLSGTLTGVGYRLNDPGTTKILDEWKQFYPVEAALKSPCYDTSVPQGSHSSPNSSQFTNQPTTNIGIPPVLEVLLGGVKMRYPACYILVTEPEDATQKAEQKTRVPKTKATIKIEADSGACPTMSPDRPQNSSPLALEGCKVEGMLPERVWQEAILTSSKETNELPSGAATNSNLWDFVDPMKRVLCKCSKCKRSSSKFAGLLSGQSTKSLKVKRSTFHRRAAKCQVNNWVNHWAKEHKATELLHPRNVTSKSGDSQAVPNQSSVARITVNPPGTPGGPPSYKAGTSSISGGVGPACDGSLLSPPSVAPSPLPTPKSQPASVSQPDPCMPTLSPQPPSDKALAISPDNCAPNSIPHQVFSPMVVSFDGAKIGGAEQSSCSIAVSGSCDLQQSHLKENIRPGKSQQSRGLLIRPALPARDYEDLLKEEESVQPSDSIHDHSLLEAWLFHPVKRVKLSNGESKTTMYNWGWGEKNLLNVLGTSHERHSLGKRAADPYEFDEENQLLAPAAVLMDRMKPKEMEDDVSPFCMSEAANAPKVGSGNLFTTEGLHPSLRDLDNLFDNSDTSSDETFQVPTPPGSNKPAGVGDDMGSVVMSNCGKGRSGPVGFKVEELSKMFPTPPSHEPNPISSPIGMQSDLPSMETLPPETSCIRRTDNYPGLGSPSDESTEDWSFVFKPPKLFKMPGSSKYAPLSILPSCHLPSLILPPNIVYKASWQCPPPHYQQQQQQQPQQQPQVSVQHLPQPPHAMLAGSNTNIPNQMHLRAGLSPISPVPNSVRGTPFDMGSPPSNNMYLKQGPNGPAIQHPHGSHISHPSHSGHPHLYATRGVEAHALVVNLSLSDSVINLFRDHNFDSCTMCVCNANSKVIGNIRGSEVGLYVHDYSPDEETIRCNCGFSATVNRRLAYHSGLFYEDEYEIATPSVAPIALPTDDWYERKKPPFSVLQSKSQPPTLNNVDKDNALAVPSPSEEIPPYLLDMLREQCMTMFGNCVISRFTGKFVTSRWSEFSYNVLECVDANRAALTALEHGRTVMVEASGRPGYHRLPEETLLLRQNLGLMHKWAFRCARGPKSSQDVMQVMRGLLPLLQDAIHAKAWDAQYTVSGPLTWRQFHRLAGRGTEDRCEPQPIPSILVGSERDWIALSPLAINFWEKLLLEPYSYPRDIAYIIVAPDNDFILQKIRLFFREFTSMYEICQLGRHCAISKVLRDGILRVSQKAATNLASEPVDDWFRSLPDHPSAAVLKLYAQVCRFYLAPQLATLSLDHNLFLSHNHKTGHEKTMPSKTTVTIDVTGSTQGPPTPKMEPGPTPTSSQESESKEVPQAEISEDDERDPPALVIYLIDPFGYSSDNEDIHRMAKLGLLRCFHSMLDFVPENIRNNISLQIISLEDIVNLGNSTLETRLKNDQMRALALSVYSQCRRQLTYQSNVKSLTGFGPAAAADLFVKNKEEKSKSGYKLYAPPYILAATKERHSEGNEWLSTIQGHTVGGLVSSGNSAALGTTVTPTLSSVLYVAYCLSEDQRWLLASVTDDRGELLETTTISIYVPNRSKRRKANSRKHGLQKLMDFILGIMSSAVTPWRLVVGRLGRIGHGELESWSTLLSRKSLLRASNQLKVLCSQCTLQFPTEAPCVLSACLVSLEPDSCLRLMPDKFTPDERFSSSGTSATLSTPQDISCTHILVFPTSATTQSSQTAFQEQHMNDGPELGDDSDLLFMVNDGIEDGIDGMNDLQLGDIFNWTDAGPGVPSPVGSPRRDSTSQPGSPGIGVSGRQSPFHTGGQSRVGGRSEGSDEVGTVLQQPLALGYMVSTAPAGPLPSWFWASCPQRESEKGCGIFLKSALHLHSHSVFHNVDDLLQQQSQAKQHPLDSQYTTDVLRFVLEGYNALSWLSLDTKTHDRRSCLPVHIQQLLQLYYTMGSLV